MATVERDYGLLQRRLDRNVTGAPDSPDFQRILRLLFTPEQARLARHISQFISVAELGDRLSRDGEAAGVGIDLDRLGDQLSDMARKGLVVDLERDGIRYVSLAPVVIGFYEFTFMRTRPDAPMKELAHLFEHYFADGVSLGAIFQANTQVGRSLVREEALPDELTVEVLDWERATSIVEQAGSVAVSLCPCRHHARLVGRGCDAPLRTCLTFDSAADALVRAEIAEPISNAEAIEILTDAKAAGLAQTADNVKQGITYMCNCCGCCCGMMTAIKLLDFPHGIVPSNWIATTDRTKCRGCGKCVKACPVDAVHLELTHGAGLRRNWSVVDPDRCLGCGVCYDACRWDARQMEPRGDRPYVPQDTFEKMVAMAIERGKLGDLLLDQTGSWPAQTMARVLHVLENTPPAKALVAIEPLRSTFLHAMVTAMRPSPTPTP